MAEVKEMESIWSASVVLPERPALTRDISTEAAVIGGGLVGILTALLLAERGVETVVLEANRIGSGQTRNTTAKLTVQHELIYDRLIQDFGLRKARQYAEANTKALAEYRRIIAEREIDCDFFDCRSFLYTKGEIRALEREAEAAHRVGLEAELTTETELPFRISAALAYEGQAAFNPMKFLAGVSEGLTVFEHTKVKRVEGKLLVCDGAQVRAKHVVFAAHFPFVNVPGYYFAKMHQGREYVIALENAAEFQNTYVGIDPDGLTFRNDGAVTLVGGGGHRTGENSKGGQYRMLRRAAAGLWPESRETRHWSAQDCMTPDGVPYIGRFSRARPDWYVCTGFNRWGMTSAMVSALLVSGMITGERPSFAGVFSPQRQTTPPAAKSILKNGLQAVKGLGRTVFKLPEENIRDLPKGHGGVVEYEGGKFGVYKDEEDVCHIVDIRCPHLGCMLEWNPDDKSWDCPCHGSRFDIQGRLLDNPAQEDVCAQQSPAKAEE